MQIIRSSSQMERLPSSTKCRCAALLLRGWIGRLTAIASLFTPIIPAAALSATSSDLRDIVRWKIANDELIYVENTDREWFRLQLQDSCPALDTSDDYSLFTKVGPDGTASYFVKVDQRLCEVLRADHMTASPWAEQN